MATPVRMAAIAAALAGGVAAYACTLAQENACDAPPDSILHVGTLSADKYGASVSTDGGCTPVHCARTMPTGCAEWQGKIVAADTCFVRIELDGGVDDVRSVTPQFVCGRWNSAVVEF